MDQKKTISSAASRSVEELQKLLLQKEGVLLAKGRLIDNMAYQIRTLSNAIIGFSDLLLMEEQLPCELMEYVKEINHAGNGLSAIVNEVLDWTRLESGRKQITRTNCNINQLLSELEHIISSALNRRGLTFSFSIDDDVPAIVIDADYLQKCLMNLIANAIRNSSAGLDCSNYKLHVSVEPRDGNQYLRFDITGGNRLTTEQICELFEPAAQEEDANNEVFSMLNMGLMVSAGLPLTRQLAESLGGKIEVISSQTDSTFSLVLEINSDTKADIVVNTNLNRVSKVTDRYKTADSLVLIVEDQPSNRTVISLMIESMGIKTESANDGFAGVEAASKKDYSVILMDLKMPGMDGYKAASEIRKMNIKTPLIALSAKVLNDAENKQIYSLFDGFLCKPIDSKNLARTLRQYLP